MSKALVSTPEAPRPGGAYSQGIICNGLIFTAGYGPQDPLTGQVVGGIEQQTNQVLRNIEAVLHEAGATLDDVVKTTVHLQDLRRDFADFDTAYTKYFREPYPVRTTVGSNLYGILVEIDVVAVLPTEA